MEEHWNESPKDIANNPDKKKTGKTKNARKLSVRD
jgi:hypothetical protein